MLAEVKLHARLLDPAEDLLRLGVGHLRGLVIERTLAEPLLEDAGGVEEVVGNDGIEHSHAALVEDTHQRLAVAEVGRDRLGGVGELARDRHLVEGHDMARVVVHGAVIEPGLQVPPKAWARKVVGPERRVTHACFRERAVEVEHAHQARPLARPVGHREDRAGVGREPREHVVGILPDRLGHDERHLGIDRFEHVEPLAGAGDEAMAAGLRRGMAPLQFPAGGGKGPHEVSLHRLLRRPADPVCLLAEIAIGDEHRPAFAGG